MIGSAKSMTSKSAPEETACGLFVFVRSHTQFVERIRNFVVIGS
jgi:hypothetical protein